MGGSDRGFGAGSAGNSSLPLDGVCVKGPAESVWEGGEGVAKRCQSVWYISLDTDALSDRPSRFFF